MAPPNKEKQAAILQQFRHQLEQEDLMHDDDTIGTDDATLLRFLRARQFDIKAATTMWINCQHWRKTVDGIGIDKLYRQLDPYDYPERDRVFECWPLWFHKTDKRGRPLNIHHFAGINMPELYKHVTPEKFWQTIVVNAESLTREVLPASARAAGRQIDGTFVIVDLRGFGIGQFWQMKNLARNSFQISQDYFPETMAQLAIINAPASFTTIWSFIKPWLAKETLAKIDILGSNYKEVLLKQIPEENLPTSLGGTCTCDELGGCKLSNAGPWMENRKERREKWLRGERKRMGLGMEGEDEDDSVAVQHELEEVRKQQDEVAEPNRHVPSHESPSDTKQNAEVEMHTGTRTVYNKSTEVVDESGRTEKKLASVSPESSLESTTGPHTPTTDRDSASSFEDARSSFTEDTRSNHSAESRGSKGRGKFRLPKLKLGKKSREQSDTDLYKNLPEAREVQTDDIVSR
ncbi:uncharacterized protein FIBRA_03946 [Fibroporia radiculosa]|uniref:CRAL-TRIO domain-containing protein n=1 Tax=Fibroporia radiculosa TaxID=599839 RepID=J4GNT6_9APHY|nr:uncharacterized protein FIBRA_03946 [Fibroporia radiculosa]CCM01875.1 predicted protein [Fibroporia radiculosa]